MAKGVRNRPHRFVRSSENGQTAIGRLDGGWAYQMDLQRQNGRWVLAELRMFPDSPDSEEAAMARQSSVHANEASRTKFVPAGGLTTRHLRTVPFGKDSPLGSLAEMDEVVLKLKDSLTRRRNAEKQGQALIRQLKALRGDVRLAVIAERYVEASKRKSRRQNTEVAQQLRLSASQVRDAVLWARRRGILSATQQQGVSGGELTEKAVALLESLKRVKANPRLAEIYNEVMEGRVKARPDDDAQ